MIRRPRACSCFPPSDCSASTWRIREWGRPSWSTGAGVILDASGSDPREGVATITDGGADVVFERTGIPSCIDDAIALCRQSGSFVWQGNYGSEPVSLHFLVPHGKRLQMFFPCDDGLDPCGHAVIRNMALGALRWEESITHRVGFDEAPAIFERIDQGAPDIVGVTIKWSEVP